MREPRKLRESIGIGELDYRNEQNSITTLREDFLDKIAELEHTEGKVKPLCDLLQELLPVYQQNLPDISSEQNGKRFAYLPYHDLSENHSLIVQVKEWAAKYHLNAEWCYEAVLNSLKNWHDYPPLLKKPLRFTTLLFPFNAYHRTGSLSPELVLTQRQREFLEAYLYRFDLEKRKSYIGKMENLIENAIAALRRESLGHPVLYLLSESRIHELETTMKSELKSLCDAIEGAAKRKGYKPPRKRSATEQHLTWLVKYQVHEMRYSHLGNYQMVKNAVVKLAREIDLPLRKS